MGNIAEKVCGGYLRDGECRALIVIKHCFVKLWGISERLYKGKCHDWTVVQTSDSKWLETNNGDERSFRAGVTFEIFSAPSA